MTNEQLQQLLSEYPGDMPIKIRIADSDIELLKDFDEENIIESSGTAFLDDEAPEEEWDNEYGKVELGPGERYLLINPVIL